MGEMLKIYTVLDMSRYVTSIAMERINTETPNSDLATSVNIRPGFSSSNTLWRMMSIDEVCSGTKGELWTAVYVCFDGALSKLKELGDEKDRIRLKTDFLLQKVVVLVTWGDIDKAHETLLLLEEGIHLVDDETKKDPVRQFRREFQRMSAETGKRFKGQNSEGNETKSSYDHVR